MTEFLVFFITDSAWKTPRSEQIFMEQGTSNLPIKKTSKPLMTHTQRFWCFLDYLVIKLAVVVDIIPSSLSLA